MDIPHVERNRLQGWLNIASALETECLDQLEWHKRYCILDKDERKLNFFNDTESVLMPHSPIKFNFSVEGPDGCISSQKKNNTLGVFDPSYSNFQRGSRQSRSFRDKVKSSLTKGNKKSSNFSITPVFQGGSVRVGRSRSFGKPDRIDQSSSNFPSALGGLKLGHSLENLHRVGSHGTPDSYSISLGEHGTTLDLAMRGTLSILPVHQSVSPRHSCFRIVTDTDIVYASCGSQEELDKWLTNLNNCRRPNRNHLRRLDTQLTIWVMEARNLQPKKKYFCEIYLNRILYAQTCCKVMNDILFWGEPFIFDDLPPLGSIMVKVHRENYNRRRRGPSMELGKVEIPALILESGQTHEKWHQITMHPAQKGSTTSAKEREKENPSIRFKIHYHVVTIQPLKVYDDFLKFLSNDYSVVCEVLEPVIPAKAKDEIAQTLVYILQVCGKAKDFLCDIVMAEVRNTENENLIFRGNTFATKAVDTYMKMVGETYLHETLAPFIHMLLENEDECEVDPTKMQPGGNLQHNKEALVKLVKKAWLDILSSYTKFPSDLQNTLHSIRLKFGHDKEDACFKLISGSIFLRFFCPAILSPSLFNLCQEYPNEKTARKLMLVAKVLQNLANFARFGVKEEYMCFMNDFVMEEVKNMKEFIKKISSPHPESHPVVEWKPRHIDLGREASIMHFILSSQLKSLQLNDATKLSIQPLPHLLETITKASEEDEGDPLTSTFEALRAMQTTISQFSTNSGDNSDSSSEYTTPAQSQAASPLHEQSPPPPGAAVQVARATVGSAAQLLAMQSNGSGSGTTEQTQNSPSVSPTHSERVSSLATHSHSAVPTRSGSGKSGSTHERHMSDVTSLDIPAKSPRRKSDPEVRKNRIRPSSQQLPGSIPDHLMPFYARTIETTVNNYDEQEIVRLRAENARLQNDLEKLQRKLDRQLEEGHKESNKFRKMEEAKRQSDHDLRHVKESRSKVFRGLNMQTEIATLHLKKDFERLNKRLQAKDEIIECQEKKIASLMEANSTLRNGLQELNSLPRHAGSDSDLDEDETSLEFGVVNGNAHATYSNSSVTGSMPNFNNSHDNTSGVNTDLLHVISQLGSGKFDD